MSVENPGGLTPDEVIDALAHLICADKIGTVFGDKPGPQHVMSPLHFDGFELLCGGDDDFVLNADHVGDQPFWPMDCCVAAPSHGEGWSEGSWQFTRIRSLDLKAWRGRLLRTSPRMIEQAVMVTEPSGNRHSARVPYCLMGRDLVRAGIRHQETNADLAQTAYVIRLMAGVSLRRQYLWSVLLGEGKGPRARFVTDPLGVREAFRLRDIPPGRQRRSALVHWVREHWRRSRTTSEAERAWIKAYLRGAHSYVWNGLQCEIIPAKETSRAN